MPDRRTFLVGAAVAAAAMVAGCATATPGADGGAAALHEHILARETGSWQYVRDRDQAAMHRFLADEALLIFGDGSRMDKAAYVASLADQTLSDLRIENARTIRLGPDTATLTYRVAYVSAMKGGPAAPVKAEVTSTYVRRDGVWLSILYQETPVR